MHRRTLRGITRFELLIGVALLAVGGVSVTLLAGTASADTDSRAVERDARRVLVAAETWQRENAALGCPTLSQLVEDRALPADAVLDDPWGTKYRIVCSGAALRVRSPGPDRRAGTEDDVVVGQGDA